MAGLNSQLIFAVIAAAFGSGFQHGYHTGVINVPYDILTAWENSTLKERTEKYLNRHELEMLWGTTTSIMNIGGTVGGLLTGVVCNKFGPRIGLLLNNILVILATALMGSSKYIPSVETMIIGRFIIGINCGLNAGLSPMYLSEISPVHLRGGISTVYQLVITISILIAQVLGMEKILGSEGCWPILFIIPAAVGAFQVVTLLFCVDSPKYLISVRNDMGKAETALKYLRKQEDVSQELMEIKAVDDAVKALPNVTIIQMIKTKSLRTPLYIAVGMMIAQQFSGINAVMFYSTQTFEEAGLSKNSAILGTLMMSTVNVLMTVASLFLVEIMGRKTVLLIGFGGMAIDTAFLAVALFFAKKDEIVAYVSIGFIVLYIVMFAPGAGPIPWFLVSEIFNQAARPTAVSLAVPTNWIANFIVTLTFPSLQGVLGPWVFIIFVVLNLLFFFFILWKVPETKNKTIEEITKIFE